MEITVALVGQLLRAQHPDLADLALRELAHGWDNTMFRLGDGLVVRLPRREAAAELVKNEQRWLPVLVDEVTLPIPAPMRIGRPSEFYRWHWSIQPWFEGVTAGVRPLNDPATAAVELGHFLAALHRPAPDDAPLNRFRGVPLADRSDITEERIDRMASELMASEIEVDDIRRQWRNAVSADPWTGPPLWLHGDLHPLNLLHDSDRLTAVIDFGDITSGDPATDLAVAWFLFGPEHGPAFRSAASTPTCPIDDAMWRRSRGWAICLAMAMLSGSADNPTMTSLARRALAADNH